MANILTNIGEEWLVENNVNGATIIASVFNNGTDNVSDATDISGITTEPGGTFARQSTTVTTQQISGDFGFATDALLEFDVSNSTQVVDHGLFIVSFQSDTVAGDTGATNHLIGVDALSQSRDTSQFDTLKIAAGDLGLTLS